MAGAHQSVAVEYNYVGLGSHDADFYAVGARSCGGGLGQPCPTDMKNNLSLVTARLNWRFGGP